MSSDIMDEQSADRIAIVGMAGRFPGAESVDALWDLICAGREAISFFPADNLDPEVDPREAAEPNYVPARGVLADADCIDAAFFGLSPREAEVMDPQGRLLLELAWETFENGGFSPQEIDGLVGVYVGSGFNAYLVDHVLNRPDIVETYGRHLVELANAPDYLASRISYKLNLHGPSVSLFTGCSSSLVAVCHAVESLLSHQSDMALAGGSYVTTPLRGGYLYREGEIFSRDGHTRPFDAAASGTVFGNGAGLVLLKRFEEAVADGDHIYAVIRGVGLNNDGSAKVSFTAPSVDGQAGAVSLALATAGVSPDRVSYIETHGTGTILGDPIEIEALRQAFNRRTPGSGLCAIGSIKANIGHLDAAAGIAGLIKTALALYHRKLPASINFQNPNPAIPFADGPFYVNTVLKDWPSEGLPRIAGVSSFGVGGTNAHVVLEEAPLRQGAADVAEWTLLPLSAKKPEALERLTRRMGLFLKGRPDLALRDVAHTLQEGRAQFSQRRVVLAKGATDAVGALLTLPAERVTTNQIAPQRREVVFLFSGQGAQYPDMARQLYHRFEVFRSEVDQSSELLKGVLGIDLRDVLFPEPGQMARARELIDETWITQPALFVTEYALARLWMSLGVYPDACAGHSIGEYVAACLAGVWSREDALKLVALRGKLMHSCPRGSMLAVLLPPEQVAPLLADGVCLAAVNAPAACVLSGPEEAIKALQARLAATEITTRLLRTSHAFHSAMMEQITEVFAREVSLVACREPSLRFVSNLTGTWIKAEQATSPAYWSAHLRQTVRFSDCVRTLLEGNDKVLLEVGPGSTLRSFAALHLPAGSQHLALLTVRNPKDETADDAFFLRTVGALWASGLPVHWASIPAAGAQRLPLPGYPFERRRHWIQRRHGRPSIAAGDVGDELATVDAVVPESNGDVGPSGSPTAGQHSPTLTKVLEVWSQALGQQGLGPEDDFFQLGGNSLLGANVIARLRKIFGVEIEPIEIYRSRTAEQLAACLQRKQEASRSHPLAAGSAAASELKRLMGLSGND